MRLSFKEIEKISDDKLITDRFPLGMSQGLPNPADKEKISATICLIEMNRRLKNEIKKFNKVTSIFSIILIIVSVLMLIFQIYAIS